MAKRFTATDVWGEDWFLEMPLGYKLFWYYILAECDHAGIFKVNVKTFCAINEVKIAPSEALKLFNNGKDRIRIVNPGVWFIEDFFVFQYGNTFNVANRVHESIQKIYNQYNISLTSIRGLNNTFLDPTNGVKDKDKDKDKLYSTKREKNGKSIINFKAQPEELMLKRVSEGISKLTNKDGNEDSSGQT